MIFLFEIATLLQLESNGLPNQDKWDTLHCPVSDEILCPHVGALPTKKDTTKLEKVQYWTARCVTEDYQRTSIVIKMLKDLVGPIWLKEGRTRNWYYLSNV